MDIDTHSFEPPLDLSDLPQRQPVADLAYVSLSRVHYAENGGRRTEQVDNIPWTLDNLRTAGLESESYEHQIAAMTRLLHAAASRVVLDGTVEFEAVVQLVKGSSRVMRRLFRCTALAGATGGGDDAGYTASAPTNPRTLDELDALVAMPGLRAAVAVVAAQARLNGTIAENAAKMFAFLFHQVQRQMGSMAAELERRDKSLSERDAQLIEIIQLLGDDAGGGGGGPPVDQAVLRETAAEVGGTLKQLALHYMGAPNDIAAAMAALGQVPAELRSLLMDPAVLAKLTHPDTASGLADTLKLMKDTP
jgi:hypothetical protein